MISGCQALPNYKEIFLSIYTSAVGFLLLLLLLFSIPLQTNRKIKTNCRATPVPVNPAG